jgi:hypothetical protein
VITETGIDRLWQFSERRLRSHLSHTAGRNGSIATTRFAWLRPLERLFMLGGVANP